MSEGIQHIAASGRGGARLLPWEGRAVLLVDLDAFFASVEQLDHPAWRGHPVIVAGDPDKHGVVSTASYEARPFGVHSGMPASTAKRLCPQAFWTSGRFDRYKQVSTQVMDILRDETPHVAQVSIDEAFLDVTPTAVNRDHPAAVAMRIQRRVEELGISCSVGVGTSKAVAKVASEVDKPRGLTVVYPGAEHEFLDPLPVGAMSGVGDVTRRKMHAHGIDTLGQLARADEGMLERLLGKNGRTLRLRAGGVDEGPSAAAPMRSISSETTFAVDLTERGDIEAAIRAQAAKVGRRLRRKGLRGRTVALRVKFDDRHARSAQRQLPHPTDDELALEPLLVRMLDELWAPGMALRLVGVSMSGFDEPFVQGSLFDLAEVAPTPDDAEVPMADEEARRRLLVATDHVKDRFGEDAVRFGAELRNADNTTGGAARNPADYK